MRVAVLAVHPVSVASTRIRAMQYAPAAADADICMQLWSFFRPRDLRAWFGESQSRRICVLILALLRMPRVLSVVRRADVILVQREALPLGPPWLELMAGRGRVLVWDVDDAVWEPFTSPTAGRVPRWLRAPRHKYERLCARADEVWAGSEVLAQWCRRLSDRVLVVPTVVDVPAEAPQPGTDRTVGWIGSHSTGSFVAAVLPAVAQVVPSVRAVVIGARPDVPAGLDVEVREWSLEAESAALRETRVGLYPVDRSHPLAEGKCGMKAVLYMSQGIPPVVTPTTTNAAVVRHGVDGLHADSLQEWTSSISALLDDHDLWSRLSEAAHRRALDEYSLHAWAPRLIARLRVLAGRS